MKQAYIVKSLQKQQRKAPKRGFRFKEKPMS